jgi:tRNA pseudouridine38-40 synthase
MPRYFIEVSYKGTAYSGFQVQENGITIQSEVEKALTVYFKQPFALTGSSRTDAGVHALQNFFHFDTEQPLRGNDSLNQLRTSKVLSLAGNLSADKAHLGDASYHLNAILPKDIVIKRVFRVAEDAHCRFDAIGREYRYYIYWNKDPFLQDRAYYFPYSLDKEKLQEAANMLLENTDFTSFSKRNTQVNNFICTLQKSEWVVEGDRMCYCVKANRFLRGMVKGLVGTMLRVGTGKISLDGFDTVIRSKDCTLADFSVPAHGLFLVEVDFNS